MQFRCDRCKTRYSISRERVRGKILKIRCKNCSTVITVRENMPGATVASEPRPPSASHSAVIASQRVPASLPPPVPAVPTIEWFLAIDGQQFGPFNQAQAEEWIRNRPAQEEIHCWAEGFADWRLVESVREFAAARAPTQRSVPAPIERNAPAPRAPVAPAAPPFSDFPQPVVNKSSGLEFAPGVLQQPTDFHMNIDEASRVVKLPLMPSDLGNMSPAKQRTRAKSTGGLPGVPGLPFDAGFAQQSNLSAQPMMRRKRTPWLLISSVVILMVGLVAVLLVVAMRGNPTHANVAARTGMADENLGREFRTPDGKIAAQTARPDQRVQTRKTVRPQNEVITDSVNSGENQEFLDIPEDQQTGVVQGTLHPDVVSRKAEKTKILFTRCHERALKKDPLLEVKKTVARVTVAPTGRVSEVALPELAGTELGTCLATTMRGWKFQQSTEGVVAQMTITFGR
jgi:predicted Zn finger-like uncharacterized protein